MTESEQKASIAKRVRQRVLRSRDRLWMVEDFDDLQRQTDSYSAVNNELRRLVARGELVRVRRGVYWRGTKSRFGMLRAPAADVVRKTISTDDALGATGWHATNLLGLSTQVSPVETLAVTHRLPEGLPTTVASRTARRGRRDEKLNGLEVTLLEALEGWDRYVETDSATALDRFDQLLGLDGIRVDRLVRASRTEPPVVRERLRAILQHAGYEADADGVPRARDPRTRERALRVIADAS